MIFSGPVNPGRTDDGQGQKITISIPDQPQILNCFSGKETGIQAGSTLLAEKSREGLRGSPPGADCRNPAVKVRELRNRLI
jgi:hypothetical protein